MPSVRCAACDHELTTTEARIDMLGRHEHSAANPSGVTYTIGCFAVAPGTEIASNPSAEWSWFPGYRWQLANCAGCDVLVGWRYVREESAFYGLILDRLRS
jgi:hypothetical protein